MKKEVLMYEGISVSVEDFVNPIKQARLERLFKYIQQLKEEDLSRVMILVNSLLPSGNANEN